MWSQLLFVILMVYLWVMPWMVSDIAFVDPAMLFPSLTLPTYRYPTSPGGENRVHYINQSEFVVS